MLTFRREGMSEDAMILPCRESPMTGTVACWNNGPFWAVLLPRDRRRREAQVSQVVTPDEDLAGALFCL